MIKTGGDVAKGMIKSGGELADRMLAKGGDFAAGMMSLTSKLSDDIGVMADRIGEMADRIERTEALMANLTAALANKKLELVSASSDRIPVSDTIVLDVEAAVATAQKGPELTITGNPAGFLLYVSAEPLFADGSTVVTHVKNPGDYDFAWRRSVEAIDKAGREANRADGVVVITVAVKADMGNGGFSRLSNSIDIRIDS